MPTAFYSWRSDHPNGINRNFIRSSLESAIEQINGRPEIEVEDSLRLDQDTQNVPGNPPIAETILQKISSCNIFIADVTIISDVNATRPTPNPNVLIEYGYALKAVGSEKTLLVMNEHFGAPTLLPFDMQHRRFPIRYSLAPTASNEEKRRVRASLTTSIRNAIEAIVGAQRPVPPVPPREFKRLPSFDHGAIFFQAGEEIPMRLGSSEPAKKKFPAGPKIFLRLPPRDERPMFEKAVVKDILLKSELGPLGRDRYQHWSWGMNPLGVCYLGTRQETGVNIDAISQIHYNGEIWGVETAVLSETKDKDDDKRPYIPDQFVRRILIDRLDHYLRVASISLKNQLPYIVIAGLVNVEDFYLTVKDFGLVTLAGPIFDPTIVREIVVDQIAPAEQLLKPFFRAMYDSVHIKWDEV